MSVTRDRYTAERRLRTAEEYLVAARTLSEAGLHAHACFAAHQAGEKAVKALWYLLGHEPWGHSIQKLVADFPERDSLPEPQAWIENAAALDRYYIPTRYPNGLPDLTPGQAYFRADSQQGIAMAEVLLDGCWRWLKDPAHGAGRG